MKKDIEELIEILEKRKARPNVVIMPDFFLDHFISFKGNPPSFLEKISNIVGQGGGNIPFVSQSIFRGGNAANTASALASLGANAHLIARTNPTGLILLKHLLKTKGMDLSHVKVNGRIALTTAIELRYKGKLVNLMINDPGSVKDFSFKILTKADLDLIKSSNFVCVFNWNQNLRGTELIKKVFSFVKKKGKGKTFLDTGDPSFKRNEIQTLIKEVLSKGLVDIFSINENEAIWFASYFNTSIHRKSKVVKPDKLAFKCADLLHERLGSRIDLHTIKYSATFTNGEKYIAPIFKVRALRTTGAGDAWKAADIYGEALGLRPEQRLLLANAATAYYVSSINDDHATTENVIQMLKMKLKDFDELSHVKEK
ncbi:MAG: carbohydrate kinase family protein [Euryarchaeota archaeon]|nr:carbohydrate kinase family protein [Euryarchaeota archaeon]